MRAAKSVFFLALGGAVWGGFAGIFGGALVGAVYGGWVGNVSLGLDGAILGGLTLTALGAVYGAMVALSDSPTASADAQAVYSPRPRPGPMLAHRQDCEPGH